MFSILDRALSWAITSFGNKLCLKIRSRLIKALNNRFYVKFMHLGIGLLVTTPVKLVIVVIKEFTCIKIAWDRVRNMFATVLTTIV